MNVERLTHLITVLERVERDELDFDMTVFYRVSPCGTAACALGYAAVDEEFVSQGLGLETRSTTYFTPIFHGHLSYFAGSEFFGLSIEQAYFIFDSYYYRPFLRSITPRQVINRILGMIEFQS